jgi:hypothetical protein
VKDTSNKEDEMGFMSLMADITFGPVNPPVRCPYCGCTNCVRTKREKVKSGISGGKATGAILTGGVSLLATGLSRKQWVTKCVCTNCKSQYQF